MNNLPPIKVYILNFRTDGVNLNALQQYLHDSVDVIAYWNYIPLVYCIKSRLMSYELALKLGPFFPHGGYLIAEINTANIDGKIAESAWDWFYLNHHEKGRPPAPIAGFGDVLGPGFGDALAPSSPPGLLTWTPPKK